MNALMTIQVRVMSAAALAQLKAVDTQMEATKKRATTGFGFPWISKWGNQVQWAGRQLMYNFTLPIGVAGIAATKWGLDNEKAMTRVIKVYGDGRGQFRALAKTEIPALANAFKALSDRFGVQQQQVINIGADWAAAGASGIQLAKATELTLKTMVLGEIDAGTATKNLIAIQAQYGQSVGELSHTIDVLNMVENQTGASMADLMEGMGRAAGVARTAGVDTEHLAAMIAALTPAAGSAATAGNGLKTIFSRLLAPTKDASDLLQTIGFHTDKLSWNSLTATQRIEELSKQFGNMSSAQKNVVSTTLGSRYQLNRFVTLMKAVRNENSYYNKSLRATSNENKVYAQSQYELNKVLSSNPQRVKQAWVIIQNSATTAISGLLPYISYLATEVAKLTQKITDMPPAWQKLTLFALIFLAAIGPIARYIGALANLTGLLTGAFHFLAAGVLAVGSGFLWLVRAPFRIFFVGAQKVAAAVVGLNTVVTEGLGATLVKSVGAGIMSVLRVMEILPAGALLILMSWRKIMLGMVLLWRDLMPAMLGAQRLFTTASIGLWYVLQRVMLINWVGMLTAASTALYSWIGQIGTILRTVPLLFVAMGTGVARALGELRVIQYVWTTQMVDIFKAFIFKVGVLFQMLPIFIGQAIEALYVFATVPGVIGGLFLRGWAAIWEGAIALFGGFITRLVALWAAMSVNLMKIWEVAWTFIRNVTEFAIIGIEKIILVLRTVGPAIFTMLTNPWVLAGVAILGVAYMLRDKIVAVWEWIAAGAGKIGANIAQGWHNVVQSILDAFYALPRGVQDAFIAILNTVRTVVTKIYEWMSYLNPFARHSPSLVDNVTNGMNAVQKGYKRNLDLIHQHAQKAKKVHDLMSYLDPAARHSPSIVDRVQSGMSQVNTHAQAGISTLQRTTATADNSKAIDKTNTALKALKVTEKEQEAAVARQQMVVDKWSMALDKASQALDIIQAKYDKWKNQLDTLSQAPIKGMSAMQKKIDDNTNAQNRLNLAMMKWEDQHGNIQDMRDQLAKLYGDMELLRGRAQELQSKGAGSDVLGPIHDQMDKLKAQADAIRKVADSSPVDQMQKQLDDLQRKGQELQLEYNVKFDPLTQQIARLANTTKELSFNQIVTGMRQARKHMTALQPALDAATAKHDRLQAIYDRENNKLTIMNDKLSILKDRMGSAGSAADKLNKKMGEGKKAASAGGDLKGSSLLFEQGKGANWPDPGGVKGISRKSLKDQSGLINDFADQQLKKMNKIMDDMDPFAPLKDKFTQVWDWIKAHVGPYFTAVFNGYKKFFGAIGDFAGEHKIWDKVTASVRWMIDKVIKFWNLIKPDVISVLNTIVKEAKKAWTEIGPSFEDLVKSLKELFKAIWPIAKPVLKILGVVLLGAIKVLASIFAHVLGPALELVIGVIKGAIQILTGLVYIVTAVVQQLTGQGNGLGPAIKGLAFIFKGTFTLIWSIVSNTFKFIIGLVKGFVGGVVGFFKWLSDVLVGHSIIPDMIAGIILAFKALVVIGKWVWNHVIQPVISVFVRLGKKVISEAKSWWGRIKTVWNVLKAVGKWIWDHVLKPVFDRVKNLWTDKVHPELKKWWSRIKFAWAVLKLMGKVFWDQYLSPVWDKIKGLWTNHVHPELAKWWDRIKTVWNSLTNLGRWIKNNVMDPIFDKIKEGWNRVKDWLSSNKDMLTNPAKAIVNAAITAVNGLISGLNAVSKALPGISFHIDAIPKLQEGGPVPSSRVGNGFITHGARAIVGEGKANWPEFVIPTDPTYRHRARWLLASAAQRLGVAGENQSDRARFTGRNSSESLYGVPAFGIGGWIGDIAKGAWNNLKKLPKNLANITFAPVKKVADNLINKIGWKIPRGAARYGFNKMTSWVTDTNKQYTESMAAAQKKYGGVGGPAVQHALRFAKNQVGKPYIWGGVGPGGYDCSGFMSALTNIIRGKAPHSRVGSTASFPWSGFISGSDKTGFTIGSTPNYGGSGIGHMAGTLGGVNVESRGGVGPIVGKNARGYNDPGFSTIAHLTKAANGAIVRARRGGVNLNVAEGGRDEVVMPLPPNWRNSAFMNGTGKTEKHVHFHGAEISFPGIKNGVDAEKLIDGLILLAED